MIEADEEDPPAYFQETKWPHPRLVRNRPQGEDEALVWVLDSWREAVQRHVDMARIRNRNRSWQMGNFYC